jgi:GxxExxY protein
METDEITGQILGGAMRVHTALGPGLLESVYRICLCHELTKRGLKVVAEKPIRIEYDGLVLSSGLRLDILVEDIVLVELKSVEKMLPLFESQLLSYLKLSGIKTGLLINFNVRHLRHGIKRMVR